MAPKTQKCCGLEVGASGAKLVLLKRQGRAVAVQEVLMEEELFESRVPGPGRPALETARKLLVQRDLTAYKTVVAPDEGTASCFVITPTMSAADAEGAILLQARKLLSWDTENPVVAHLDSEFLRSRTGSVVGLADWKTLAPWCKLVEGSGGLVEDITLPACAYQALADHQEWAKTYPVVLVAGFGASASHFTVLDRGMVRFVREVPIGGDAVTKAFTTQVSTDQGPMHLNPTQAEAFKIRGELAQTEMLVRPVLERLSSEIARSIQFVKENAGRSVDAVFVTGGTAGLKVLVSHLESSLGLPVKPLDPFEGVEFVDAKVAEYAKSHRSRLAVAVGLALAKRPGISLLPKVFQMAKRLTRFASATVLVLMLGGFCPLLIGGTVQMIRIQAIRPKIEAAEKEVASRAVAPEEVTALDAQVKNAAAYCEGLKDYVGHEPRWPGVLNALAEVIPEHVVLTRFSTDDVKRGGIAVVLEGGVLKSKTGFHDAVSQLLSSLSDSFFFSHVALADANTVPRGMFEGTFEIHCELVY